MLHLTNHPRQFRAFLNLRLRESENALSKVFDTPELGFTVVWDYEGDRVTVSVKAADVGSRVKQRLIQLGHAISAVASSQCGDCGVKHYGAPHQCTASKMTDSEKIQNRADLLQAFADEPEGRVAHHDLFAGDAPPDDTEDDGTSAEQAELFVCEVEITTGHRLESAESARWIRALTGMTVIGSPVSLGRYACGDEVFRRRVTDRITQGTSSLQREALTDFLGAAALLSVKEPGYEQWFDTQKAWADYLALSKAQGYSTDDSERAAHRFTRTLLTQCLTKRRPAAPDLGQLLALRDTFPNLEEPITWIAQNLAMAMHRASGQGHFSMPPILLVGPPGIGKTHIAHSLSRLINGYQSTINMSSMTHGFVLSGTDRKWGQSAPGAVFKAMLDSGPEQMPVIILDEIDKTDSRLSNTLAPLYHLLDPVMAPRFVDEFMGFSIDTSSITWIATANEKSTIPEPLLDRFQVFDIPAPNREQLNVIVRNIYAQIAGPISYMPSDIPDDWLRNLENVSLRQVSAELKRAIGKIALHREMNPGSPIDLSSAAMKPVQRKRMGF
jgi:ATP-dependent Lon protease